MTRTYWIAFKIAEHGAYKATYEGRYLALESAIAFSTTHVLWKGTPSFLIFDSDHEPDEIVAHIRKAIDIRVDLAVLGAMDGTVGRMVGPCRDPSIFQLMPFKKEDRP